MRRRAHMPSQGPSQLGDAWHLSVACALLLDGTTGFLPLLPAAVQPHLHPDPGPTLTCLLALILHLQLQAILSSLWEPLRLLMEWSV